MTNWYAVRTTPGATKPAATYRREVVNVKNGRKAMVRHVKEGQSVIEASMIENGIWFYMPVELKTDRHHRTKALIHKRSPLIPGHVFVADILDWQAFEALPGVLGVIRVDGVPFTVSEGEMERLRNSERAIDAENAARFEASMNTKKKLKEKYPTGSKVVITAAGHHLEGRSAMVSGATGRQTIKAMVDLLSGQGTVELSLGDFEGVAA